MSSADRKQAAYDKLKGGVKCDNCPDKATITYVTSCHGDWFMCEKHNTEYQTKIKEVDKKYE